MRRSGIWGALLLAVAAFAGNARELNVWPSAAGGDPGWRLSDNATWVRDASGEPVLRVTNKVEGQGALYELELDLAGDAGCGLEVSAEIRIQDVSKPKTGYLGTKFMLPYTIDGITTWLSATDGVYGSFDWRPFSLNMVIPPGLDRCVIALGLQESTGTVEFRNLRAEIVPADAMLAMPYELPEGFQCEYSEAIADRPPMRGAMVADPRWLTLTDLQALADLGANLFRWQFIADNATDLEDYNRQLDASLDKFVRFAPELKRMGLMAVFDMHTPPGSRYSEPSVLGTAGTLAKLDGSVCMRIFMEDVYYDAYVASWRKIADRLKDTGVVWGYDLLNEPTPGGQKLKRHSLLTQYGAAYAIREVDPETPIVIEADEWANPNSFAWLQPVPLKNVIYSFHFYLPGEYTHQGATAPSMERIMAGEPMLAYPGAVTAENLRNAMEPIAEFQQRYGAQIFCGEFSVIRWAPGAPEWLHDVLNLLEEHRWSWTFHAFREWSGWSPEHGSDWRDPNPVSGGTPRLELLKDAYSRNRNPYSK